MTHLINENPSIKKERLYDTTVNSIDLTMFDKSYKDCISAFQLGSYHRDS